MKLIHKTNRKGFTLLEIMLVVAILVVLASISFINIGDSLEKSNARKSAESSKFVIGVQSETDYIRESILAVSQRSFGNYREADE